MTAATAVGTVGVLVMVHGTPAAPADLESFYTEIRRGSPPPPDLLADLRRRYDAIGGLSPLAAHSLAQAEGVAAHLEAIVPGRYQVALGAKFAAPRIADAVADLVRRGADRLVGLVLAPHSSTVSTADYERRARAAVAESSSQPPLSMVDHWYDAPGFAPLVAGRVTAALARLTPRQRDDAVVVFSAHSIPEAAVAGGDTYAGQVADSAQAVADAAGVTGFEVAWQSAGRSGGPWLGPDLNDVIARLGAEGAAAVVVCPVGFVSDHLEILYDLDVEAADAARRAGVAFVRTATFNDDPGLCRLLAEVVHVAAGGG